MHGFFAWLLDHKLIVLLLVSALMVWGLLVAPFDWDLFGLPRDPVPVDAIPDLGENQQIVFTEWPGRSPQDMEDQVSYPLTVNLLGLPGVKTIRSYSLFGFSTVYVIFKDDVDFYWSRSRILEKLASLPSGTLPDGVRPTLGPDATALGQVFWYTLEGRDEEGRPAGGWDPHELRSIQDFYVRYALQGVEGVSEAASVGGFVREYQVDVDPEALLAYGVTLEQVFESIRMSNEEVGARTVEVNRVEYVIRGVGFLKSLEDLEATVVATRENLPVRVRDIATVGLGPALRRGALDKGGSEAVGGVVVVRFGENPLAVIERVKERIEQIAPGLPSRELADGRVSKVTVVPFYDRTGLIHETLDTLQHALGLEVLVTMLVVLVMVRQMRASILISMLLPAGVLLTFVAMKVFGVDANVVALAGIAIAIGTMVDMGVVLSENIVRHVRDTEATDGIRERVLRGTTEVAGAVLTAIATTVVGFLPVLTLQGAEGKLFTPLAWTKTFALVSAVMLALVVLPVLAQLLYSRADGRGGDKGGDRDEPPVEPGMAMRLGVLARIAPGWLSLRGWPSLRGWHPIHLVVLATVTLVLTRWWMPLGLGASYLLNLLFLVILLGGFLLLIHFFQRGYSRMLGWALEHKALFLSLPIILVLIGGFVWRGLGREFMPTLQEGSFLFMPTTMPHAGMEESLDVLSKLDRAIEGIPEVEMAVGKIGRAESALDPAPLSMVETVITLKPEYSKDEEGNLHRNWRDEIKSADDVWAEILRVTKLPGTTSAPRLQPIEARLVMLQSGMRAPMGIKVKGPDLETLEQVGLELEAVLKDVPGVQPASVFADRVVGKPYLEIRIDREAIGRYGIPLARVQRIIEVAIGGSTLTTTVEGRERYPVRVRYPRERRDSIEDLGRILVPGSSGEQIPLTQLSTIEYVRGPQMIKSEDTFLLSYVLFDKSGGESEVEVVERVRAELQRRLDDGRLVLPAGVSYEFAGSYENQVRSMQRLKIVMPVALLLIFVLLQLQFGQASSALMVFSGIAVAWAGGFLLLGLYGQGWFLDLSFFGHDLREVFQVRPVHLSVAVWVGFLALFGIASDDGVVMASYLKQVFATRRPENVIEVRDAVLEAGRKRIRPCLMTTATTVLALLPVLSSTGRGSELMLPLAIPVFGGMLVELVTLFVVPVLWSAREERVLRRG